MNDCFMNASLQLLTHEESLIENILNESKINYNTPGKGKLIPEFKKLIGEINNNLDYFLQAQMQYNMFQHL